MTTAHALAFSPPPKTQAKPAEACLLVLFGARGDLVKRLLMPALYNLACAGILPERFAIVAADRASLTSEEFRRRISDPDDGIVKYHTRKDFDAEVWQRLANRIYYTDISQPDGFSRLLTLVRQLDGDYQTGDNLLFYFAVPPSAFATISSQLFEHGFNQGQGWRRIIVEKPFGTDLASARSLSRAMLTHWDETQIYRVDHYLGKETVQNILAFRFANGMFEPLWSRDHIDHIQLTVTESVSVEGRGKYYDHAGVLRDMIQNHMFQIMAYLCMEPPASFAADDIRDAKAQLLNSVRRYKPDDVQRYCVRGQYDSGKKADGSVCPAYRNEPDVRPDSNTETFAALRLFIDNARWEGVPVYLRSGKALWTRGTQVVMQFKKPTTALLCTPAGKPSSNRLIFHIQPDQAIETVFQAKIPGPHLQLQPVRMRFDYGEAFRAVRGTGYEVMLYSCMNGDATLFSRSDLVETAWSIAQPILDAWSTQAPADFPNYAAGTWGPSDAYELLTREGRRWYEVVSRETLQRVPLFEAGDRVFLSQLAMSLQPRAVAAGETIINEGEPGTEMFLICRGEVDVIGSGGEALAVLRDGDVFGEVALLMSAPRTATVRARTACDLFILEQADFFRLLHDQPQIEQAIRKVAHDRYHSTLSMTK